MNEYLMYAVRKQVSLLGWPIVPKVKSSQIPGCFPIAFDPNVQKILKNSPKVNVQGSTKANVCLLSKPLSKVKSIMTYFKILTTKSVPKGFNVYKSTIYIPRDLQCEKYPFQKHNLTVQKTLKQRFLSTLKHYNFFGNNFILLILQVPRNVNSGFMNIKTHWNNFGSQILEICHDRFSLTK